MKGGESMAQRMKSRPRRKLKRPQFKEDDIPVEQYVPKTKIDIDRNLKLFSCDFEPLYTIDAFPIIYNHLQDLQFLGLDHNQYGFFVKLCYNKHTLEGSDVKLKMVTKMSCSSICEPIYYLTFTVVDVDGNENTLQAMVLQFGIPRQFLLGMLRDASHDKVLAIIRFKEAPTEVVAQKLEDVLKKVGEKVLFKT